MVKIKDGIVFRLSHSLDKTCFVGMVVITVAVLLAVFIWVKFVVEMRCVTSVALFNVLLVEAVLVGFTHIRSF